MSPSAGNRRRSTKTVARKSGTKKTAAKKKARKTATKAAAPRRAAKKTVAKKAAAKKSKRAPARKKSASARKSATRKSTAQTRRRSPSKRAATTKRPASKKTPARRKTSTAKRQRPVSPEVARRHFQELLEAKQERVRQGPSYPAPNAFTGRRDEAEISSAAEPAPPEPGTGTPEAVYGGPEFAHGRGNQGMRRQN